MLTPASIIPSIIGVAGCGFRLSLVLNAVGVESATADLGIQSIARSISQYSLVLKQVALALESAKGIASQSAFDTAKGITDQGSMVFDEMKEVTEMVQRKDERGNIQSIAVAQRVKWYSKHQRVLYLQGQLESLKLSLSILLQILQLGRLITSIRYSTRPIHKVLCLLTCYAGMILQENP